MSELEQISFIKKEDKIEVVPGGFSGALTYKIMKKDEVYFLKVLQSRKNDLERLQEILEIYHKSGVDTVHLVECGNLPQQERYFCIYDWIDGVNLSSFIDQKEPSYFYEVGQKVGEKLKQIKQIKWEAKYIDKFNLSDKVQEWIALLELVPEEVVCRYFNKKEVQDIKEKMTDYIQYFDEKDKCFVHTDIKLGNIMLDKEKIYIIDIESMEYNYDIFNMICWAIGGYQEGKSGACNLAFQKGILAGFELQRKNLDKQILFMYMANFCFATYGKYKKKQNLNQLNLFKIAYDRTNKFTKLEW